MNPEKLLHREAMTPEERQWADELDELEANGGCTVINPKYLRKYTPREVLIHRIQARAMLIAALAVLLGLGFLALRFVLGLFDITLLGS